jgi:hypothetical protein
MRTGKFYTWMGMGGKWVCNAKKIPDAIKHGYPNVAAGFNGYYTTAVNAPYCTLNSIGWKRQYGYRGGFTSHCGKATHPSQLFWSKQKKNVSLIGYRDVSWWLRKSGAKTPIPPKNVYCYAATHMNLYTAPARWFCNAVTYSSQVTSAVAASGSVNPLYPYCTYNSLGFKKEYGTAAIAKCPPLNSHIAWAKLAYFQSKIYHYTPSITHYLGKDVVKTLQH